MQRSGRQAIGGLMLFVLLGAGLAACGDDASGDAEAYCENVVAIETLPDPDVDFETATPAQISEATKDYAAGIVPLAEKALAAAPDDVHDDIDILTTAIRKVASTGDFEAFEGDAKVQGAQERSHQFDLDTCDISTSDVKGIEYAFEGVERTYDAGLLSFEFSNGGKEQHEFILFKKNDGVTESAQDLLALPEDQAFSKVSSAGGVGPTAPDKGDYDIVRLDAGDYFAICFLPVGNDPKDFEGPPAEGGGGEEAPPHFTKGMVSEFTVQ